MPQNTSVAGPEIGFICEASTRIGGGHVMRCLTLACEMQRRGAIVRFAVNKEAWEVVPSLQRAPFAISTVPYVPVTPDIWADRLSAIVFDSYAIDSHLEIQFRPKASKIIVIDDLANRSHDCDLVIDSNWGRSTADYFNLVPGHAQILCGPNYSLLRPEFAAMRPASLSQRARGSAVTRILISLGLTDVGAITAKVVNRLLSTQMSFTFDVVIGAMAESLLELEALATIDDRVALHIDPPNMARLMANADVAIGAGGTTSWERCCLGLPTVVVVLADNQRPVAAGLESAGAAAAVYGVADDDLHRLSSTVEALIGDTKARIHMASAASGIADGRGAGRVSAALLALIDSAVPCECQA